MSYSNGPKIVTDGLVLYLDAGNSKSYPGAGTSWYDLSGNGNDGTLTNGPTYSTANKGSMVFDGSNDYMVKESINSFNVYCINIWIKSSTLINAASATQSLIQLRYQQAAGNYAWYISFGASTSLVNNEYITIADVQTNKRTCVTNGSSLQSNIWYNLVFNYESSQYKIYINNILTATTNSSAGHVGLLSNPNKLYLSALDGDGSSIQLFFNGNISQVSIYNRSLTIAEILQNYNATKGRYGL